LCVAPLQLLEAGDGAADIIAETGAKSVLPKIVKTGYSALNVRVLRFAAMAFVL